MRTRSFPKILPIAFSLCLCVAHESRANNIQVTNATLASNTGTSILVQFDLGWENSWRGGGVNNWDAAWVFVKFRTSGGIWQHVLLSNTGHTAPAGSLIEPGLLTPGGAPWDASTNPVIGAFVRRSANGTGNVAWTGVQLRWDYGSAGLAYNDITQVQVFAIEMVQVLQGSFAAGSGGAENASFTLTTINTANGTTAPAGTGSLGGQAGGYPTNQFATNLAFPNGFNAFYCMKYEVSQQGYVDFLNTLSYYQQYVRTDVEPNSAAGSPAFYNQNRNAIEIQTPGVNSTTPAVFACNLDNDGVYGETVDGKDIACNRLGWPDLEAYLDWSGLRPMTEMEFEKTCRGPLPPVPNEYVWGTTAIANTNAYTLNNAGTANEGIATNYYTLGNANYNLNFTSIAGPHRVGIYAANAANNGRAAAGAAYYGAMEMSGNLRDQCVTVTSGAGRSYTGVHGNGALSTGGDADALNWPLYNSTGVGYRGGTWASQVYYLRTSDRSGCAVNEANDRWADSGGRGVRGVP